MFEWPSHFEMSSISVCLNFSFSSKRKERHGKGKMLIWPSYPLPDESRTGGSPTPFRGWMPYPRPNEREVEIFSWVSSDQLPGKDAPPIRKPVRSLRPTALCSETSSFSSQEQGEAIAFLLVEKERKRDGSPAKKGKSCHDAFQRKRQKHIDKRQCLSYYIYHHQYEGGKDIGSETDGRSIQSPRG